MEAFEALAAATLVVATASCTDRGSDSLPAQGDVEGVVSLAAGYPPPEPRSIENTTDPEVCGREQSLEDVSVSAAGGIGNAIVALSPIEPVEPAAGDDAETGPLLLDNRDCRFLPHSAAATAGQTLVVVNSDPTLHTVHLYGPEEENIALPIQGMRVERRLSEPGLYQVKCDVHGWMQAFIRVDPHPFHAVTGPDGDFRIPNVPAGSYTLDVWQERLSSARQQVQVPAGGLAGVRVTLPANNESSDSSNLEGNDR